ncbi:hypothetical protein PHMEG_00038360 [Phytophthora megakarya]|uniref:Uncharacterized protein n=1 Tax=Phytophthora megakarya TaxID=4795 RepID=A0A225UHY3_9STRA|nr:hypothetical protein PHMEG_00038360 [Phytophthora megakarya]
MKAAKKCCFDVLWYLIERGANANIRNNDGETTLIMAAASGNTKSTFDIESV